MNDAERLKAIREELDYQIDEATSTVEAERETCATLRANHEGAPTLTSAQAAIARTMVKQEAEAALERLQAVRDAGWPS